jgi:hypothetical protein
MIKRIALSIGSAVLALAAMPVQAQTYSNAVQALNPVAYWPLTETTPSSSAGLYVATNSGTLGASGNGYYETWWQPDASGVLTNLNSIVHVPGALLGDSDVAMQQGAVGQYVVIPRTTNGVVNPAVTLDPPFSIEMWIYPTNAAANKLKPVFAEGFNNVHATNTHATVQEGTALGMYSGFLYFVTFNGAGAKTEIDTGTLVLNHWHHIVATFDGTSQTLYLDGNQVGSPKTPPLDSLGRHYEADPVSPMIIGGGNELGLSGGANVFFGGAVDEVAVYNTVLAGSQVTTHYQAGTSATPPTPYNQVVTADSPIIYLRLDEPAFAGPSATNSPVAANTGSLGAPANGYYLPGTTPGISGPAFNGFPTPSYAVAFNGFNSAVDVGAGALPTLLNPTNHQPMTVTAWFKGNPADCVGRFQVLMGHSDAGWRLTLDTSAGNRFNPGNGPELQFANVTDVLTNGMYLNDGNWHFVAGVSDGTNDSLYLDGVLAKSGVNETTVTNGSRQDVILGGDPQYLTPTPTGGRWFDGSLSHVAFFTNALATAQIQQLYTAAGVAPALVVAPQSVTNNAGVNVSISPIVHGSAPLYYQWYQNGTMVPTQTNASLSYTSATTNNNGSYFVIATNNFGAVTSSVVTLFLYGTPVIQQQSSTDIHVFAGSNPTLRISAVGEQPISYQWSVGGSPIPNATNSFYTIVNAQTGGTYTCAVTNVLGAAAPGLSPIVVTILPDPTAPYPSAVFASGPIAYYRLNESPDDGAGNNGRTAYDSAGGYNAVYTNVLLSQSGYSLASDAGDPAIELGDFPPNNDYAGNVPTFLNFSTTNGGNGEFSVEAWFNQYLFLNGGDGIVSIGYGNGGEEFVLDTGAGSSGAVRFFVRNAAGTVSGASSSIVTANDGKWHHAVGVCDEAGGKVYLYLDGVQVASANITAGSGILSSSMPLTIGARESANFTTVSNDFQFIGKIDEVALYNRALSATEVLNHYYGSGVGPVLTQISPYNWITNQNSTVTFTVTAGGTAPLFYQWYNPSSQPIPNQTNATLTLNNVQLADQGSYTVVVTNLYNSASTNTTLTINQGPPVIVTDLTPTNLTVYAGSTVTYSFGVSGTPPIFYQWFKDGVSVAGATNSSYTFTALLGTNTYYCSATNSQSAGTPTVSSTATVAGMPVTTLNPASYSDRVKITFSGYNRGETLQDFPVLVRLGTNVAGFNYSHFASTTGGDLRFTDASGTRVIPSEIDEWNVGGTSTVWVQIPTLSGVNDFIWAYWGNSSDTTAPAGTNVWVPPAFENVPAYQVVYHMKEAALPFADSTQQHPATNGVAPVPTNGVVGTAGTFDGTSWLDVGTNDVGNTFTLSAWVNIPAGTSDIQDLWANFGGGYAKPGFALFVNSYQTSDQIIDFATGDGTGGDESKAPAGTVPSGSWHMVTAAINRTNGTVQMYLDGNNVASSVTVVKDFPTLNDVNLGRFVGGSFPFHGALDEARIRSSVSSSNWVWASWATVAQNSSLENYGSVSSTLMSPITIQFQRSGNNLVLSGSGGSAGASYRVLTTTNVALPTAQWTPVATNPFASDGNWTNTMPIDSSMQSQYFRIVTP